MAPVTKYYNEMLILIKDCKYYSPELYKERSQYLATKIGLHLESIIKGRKIRNFGWSLGDPTYKIINLEVSFVGESYPEIFYRICG